MEERTKIFFALTFLEMTFQIANDKGFMLRENIFTEDIFYEI